MNLRGILYAVFAMLGVAAIAGGLVLQFQTFADNRDSAASGRPVESSDEPVVSSPEVAVLTGWDRRRAAAYAASDVDALRELYRPGSRTGAADVAALREYADRALQVRGMRMQLLAVDVVSSDKLRVVLDVTDRLVGAEVIGGGDPVPLPRDRADRRRVTLELLDGAWVVVEIRRAGQR
ncbi:MAG: hypothetical protein L0H93_02690 [Nocardioides sp.]|nr:hypothetical protein [Nocardioides sp.]